MGYTASEIITRFEKYAGLEHGTEPDGKKGRNRTRFPSGRSHQLYYRSVRWSGGPVTEIQSYGSHFPLGRLVLRKNGKRRFWVLNGDRWGGGSRSSTDAHNEMLREAVQQARTPWIILPFSALQSAGIDVDTITVVHQEPERWEPEAHSAARLEDVPQHHRKQRLYRDATGAVITPPLANDGREAHPDYRNGGWHVNRHSALKGWQQLPVAGPDWEGMLGEVYEEITPGPDGRYHWTEQRHWLGESVFRASYTRRDPVTRQDVPGRAHFLSAFDTNEPRPMYFLAELPAGARPKTVEEAREALKPKEVKDAEAAGITVLRQGDVFAIPQPGLRTRDLPRPATVAGRVPGSRRSNLVLGVNHKVTEMRMRNGSTFARGRLYHARKPAEHVTVNLGDRKTWHLLVRNTVPAFQLGTFLNVRAWSLGGRVD